NPPLSQAHFDFLEEEAKRPGVDGPRSWNPDSTAVLEEIIGLGVPIGYLETVMAVHRLAHIAVDREGRQVGEMNTFPDPLRLRTPTEWKTCNYAGGRYQDEMPMNMSALKSMLAHWKPVLQATLLCREEFLKRFPQSPDGTWKLGEVHAAASHVLALVSLQVMRWKDPVKNGDLDPVLSSLFRVIDGVRMVTAFMLDHFERPMLHGTPVAPRDVTGAAERHDQYRSGRGVCAGPQNMIDELVETLMHGKPVEGAPALGEWTADIPLALDYALLGLQVLAPASTVWLRMGLAYTRIREALERSAQLTQGRVGKLREAIERDWQRLIPVRTIEAAQRDFAEPFYQRMYDNAQRGVRGLAPEKHKSLKAELMPPPGLLGESAGGALRDLFASTEAPELAAANGPLLQEIAGHVLDYLRFERNALRVVTDVQRDINALLGRPQPDSPLTGRQLAIHHDLRRQAPFRGQNYLIETISETLEIAIENQKDATTLSHGGRSLVIG
ncbi:MAG TPA: hypothetical protein VH083_07190, partial [Myxococcales bacterium]|nr:hypothetical protein [Myxococcales bacterium]